MITAGKPRSGASPLRARLYSWARVLHLYLSMLALMAVLFFALTGLTLNHPEWFGEGRVRKLTGTLADAPYLQGETVNWLRLAEDLRALGLRGRVSEYGQNRAQAWLSFRAPGYGADAQVDLKTGVYTLSITEAGLVAALNDLHKGRDTPGAWKWAIDLSALFLTLVSLTGLLLSLFLRKTRRAALLTLLLGLLLFGGLALWASL
ncbi:PepSY-associated TM helix domain-containing protein [Thermus caldifontis]|uniref:PepSY-associated TM helix domain-containing protein n=1 Tax=Thermus caldifontis TaxID=1930763 RepID=UPI000DF341C2|nr:PepSY-associated TM helix domain-containing protein [Thermus caldifontis]